MRRAAQVKCAGWVMTVSGVRGGDSDREPLAVAAEYRARAGREPGGGVADERESWGIARNLRTCLRRAGLATARDRRRASKSTHASNEANRATGPRRRRRRGRCTAIAGGCAARAGSGCSGAVDSSSSAPSPISMTPGGLRRAYLRGHPNILKRLLVHAGAFNLGVLMRTVFGRRTPRGLQGLAALPQVA